MAAELKYMKMDFFTATHCGCWKILNGFVSGEVGDYAARYEWFWSGSSISCIALHFLFDFFCRNPMQYDQL